MALGRERRLKCQGFHLASVLKCPVSIFRSRCSPAISNQVPCPPGFARPPGAPRGPGTARQVLRANARCCRSGEACRRRGGATGCSGARSRSRSCCSAKRPGSASTRRVGLLRCASAASRAHCSALSAGRVLPAAGPAPAAAAVLGSSIGGPPAARGLRGSLSGRRGYLIHPFRPLLVMIAELSGSAMSCATCGYGDPGKRGYLPPVGMEIPTR